MLDELRSVHREMLALIADHEAMIAQDNPSAVDIAPLRLRLTKTNGRRVRLLGDIYAAIRQAPPEAQRTIDQFRQEDRDMASAVSRHIGQWTIDRIIGDWEEYRKIAGSALAWQRRRIADEKRVLYPLLS